jgi:predicted CopG family antitoxin
MTKRITLEVSDEVYAQLEELKKRRGSTMTDVFRRAIGTEAFLDEQVQEGSKVLLEDPNGKFRQIVWK